MCVPPSLAYKKLVSVHVDEPCTSTVSTAALTLLKLRYSDDSIMIWVRVRARSISSGYG